MEREGVVDLLDAVLYALEKSGCGRRRPGLAHRAAQLLHDLLAVLDGLALEVIGAPRVEAVGVCLDLEEVFEFLSHELQAVLVGQPLAKKRTDIFAIGFLQIGERLVLGRRDLLAVMRNVR